MTMTPLTRERYALLRGRLERARKRFPDDVLRRAQIWTGWCCYVVKRGGWPYDDARGQEVRKKTLAHLEASKPKGPNK
jgi:hypothetical protein